jgi:hypothetical protein
MKAQPSNKTNRIMTCLAMVALLVMTSVGTMAQSPRIINRPVTPDDVIAYNLPAGTQESTGLSTVGVGAAIYLEAQVLKGTPVANIIWSLTAQPTNSTATLAAGPLGANVLSWEPSDQQEYDVAGRQLLVPDKKGQYTIMATVTSGTNTIVLTNTFTAATYVGVGTIDGAEPTLAQQCAQCHMGTITPDKVTPWSQTGHASFFTQAIDGIKSSHYSSNCISCHVVGYDTAPTAVNGGFDDVAKQLNWSFPTVLTNGNWAALPDQLKQLSNIQCENCHGPGSEHRGNITKISESFSAGLCASCHSEEPYHFKPAEWLNSRHAVAVREEGSSCVGCHSGIGFVDRVSGAATNRTEYAAITCATCHDPHSAANPSQLRTVAAVKLMDSSKPGGATVVTNGGKGQLCMNCHMSRRDAVSYVTSNKGSNRFGPHHGPQSDMLQGVNAITYGKVIPSSAHSQVVSNTCVTCHMQTVATSSPVFSHAGGHTFMMAYDNETNSVDLVGACQKCHGQSVTSFDMARSDYDGNGVIEGVQTEVQGLCNQLSVLLPPLGQVKSSLDDVQNAITASYTQDQLNAAYNLLFVLEDRSFGIHNTAYAVGLLQASLANLQSISGPSVVEVNNTLSNYFAHNTDYIINPDVLGGGKYQLSVDNLIGWNLIVQASSDLTTWTNLPTATMPFYQFMDPDATNAQKRFYRLRYPNQP